MFCPVLYTFKKFWSKYLLTDLAYQTGILIEVLVLSWKRRWWRLICTLSKSHFAVSPSMSAARCAPVAAWADGSRRARREHRQSRCAPQFYRAFPFPSLLVAAAQLSRVRPNHPLWDILQSVSHLGYFKLKSLLCTNVLNSIYFWKWTNANPMKIFRQLASHPKLLIGSKLSLG